MWNSVEAARKKWVGRAVAYSTASGYSICAFRIALGFTCAADAIFTWVQVGQYLRPPQLLEPGMVPEWSPLDALPPGIASELPFFAVALLSLLYVVGIPGVRWVLPVSLAMLRHRVAIVETGGMATLQLALVCSWLMPINRVGSLCQWWSLRHSPDKQSQIRNSLNRSYSSYGFALICLQLATNYFFNAYNKLTEPWAQGIAVSRALSNANLSHGLGIWLADLPEWFSAVLNYGALATEFSLPILVLTPLWRAQGLRLAALLMLGLHGFIAASLAVGIFSYAMLCHVPLLALARLRNARTTEPLVEPSRPKAQAFQGALAAVYVLVLLASLDRLGPQTGLVPLPQILSQTADWMRLRQAWGMFAIPLDRAFITVSRATTSSGRTWDPWRTQSRSVSSKADRIARSAYRNVGFFMVDATTFGDDDFRSQFSNWLQSRAAAEAAPEKLVSLSGWTLVLPAEKKWLIRPDELSKRTGAFSLTLPGAIPYQLEASQIWAPERISDGQWVPEGTAVLSPVGASWAPECAHIVLRFEHPADVRALLIQADAFDHYVIEGSANGTDFEKLTEMERLRARQYRTRIVPIEASRPLKALRLHHLVSRNQVGYTSEIVVFDHIPTMPKLPVQNKEVHFVGSYERPAAMGLFAWPTRASGACPFPIEKKRGRIVH